jgi:hypothetical protein
MRAMLPCSTGLANECHHDGRSYVRREEKTTPRRLHFRGISRETDDVLHGTASTDTDTFAVIAQVATRRTSFAEHLSREERDGGHRSDFVRALE